VQLTVDHYSSTVERFLPSFVPSASYLRHTGREQAVEWTEWFDQHLRQLSKPMSVLPNTGRWH
jgi:hypothetical protein